MYYLKGEDLKKVLIHKGVLQEANRTFFHPLGLALGIAYLPENEIVKLMMQCTDEKEGFIFETIDKTKLDSFRDFSREKHTAREEELHYIIQTKDLDRTDGPEPEKKKQSYTTRRFNVVTSKMREFFYFLHKRFEEKHLEKDKELIFPSKERIKSILLKKAEQNNWVDVANCAYLLENYDHICSEINSLGLPDEESNK